MKAFLVIIPARGGSKGIKQKNIIDVCGKPLIEYTITPALGLINYESVKKIIISTDDPRIAGIAKELGADVPFLRPSEFATDTAPGIAYQLHALRFFEEQNLSFDAVMTLQPTSPLRKFEDMLNAIALYNAHSNDSLISVYREDTIRDSIIYTKQGNVAIPVNRNHNKASLRQAHAPIYIRNGAIYITSVEYLKHSRQSISDTPLLYEMPKSRSLNLDTMEDLKILRWMLCK
jgi:CMP-N-acetylneuraminic acid synthetase